MEYDVCDRMIPCQWARKQWICSCSFSSCFFSLLWDFFCEWRIKLLVKYFCFSFKTFSNVLKIALLDVSLFSVTVNHLQCNITLHNNAVKLSAIQMNYHLSSVLCSCQDIFKYYVSWLCKLLMNICSQHRCLACECEKTVRKSKESWLWVIKNGNSKHFFNL